ncbi:MAG: hypothetical protein Q7T38_06555, partial [Gallionella sp.]|nr:hypothetical protein [Gallionella sp.]
ILYLGDSASTGKNLTDAGLKLLPLPDTLTPKGDAAYLHPLFEFVASSARGQLAPLQLRARHLAESLRRAAFAGIAASLLAVILFGQQDFRALINLHGREQTLNANLQQTTRERDLLAGRISASGTDPALVRQATKFAALEMEAPPALESILQFAAATIADLPQVRIKSLTFRFPKQGERYCQGQSVIPLFSGSEPSYSGNAAAPQRFSELQFSILLTENLTPAAQIDIRKRISAALKARDGVQLMQDPAAFSLINTLKGGFGMETASAENLWCMSIPWSTTPAPLSPGSPPETPSPQSSPASGRGSERGSQSLIPAVERESASLREPRVKGLP